MSLNAQSTADVNAFSVYLRSLKAELPHDVTRETNAKYYRQVWPLTSQDDKTPNPTHETGAFYDLLF